MNEHTDPVDRALNLLKAQSWAHDAHDAKLEENLMQMVSTKPKAFGSAKRNALVGALALLPIAGVGFAATGGMDTFMDWFLATVVVVGPDGTRLVDLARGEPAARASLDIDDPNVTDRVLQQRDIQGDPLAVVGKDWMPEIALGE